MIFGICKFYKAILPAGIRNWDVLGKGGAAMCQSSVFSLVKLKKWRCPTKAPVRSKEFTSIQDVPRRFRRTNQMTIAKFVKVSTIVKIAPFGSCANQLLNENVSDDRGRLPPRFPP